MLRCHAIHSLALTILAGTCLVTVASSSCRVTPVTGTRFYHIFDNSVIENTIWIPHFGGVKMTCDQDFVTEKGSNGLMALCQYGNWVYVFDANYSGQSIPQLYCMIGLPSSDAFTEKVSSTTEEAPSTTEKVPSTTEKVPSITEKVHTTTEKVPRKKNNHNNNGAYRYTDVYSFINPRSSEHILVPTMREKIHLMATGWVEYPTEHFLVFSTSGHNRRPIRRCIVSVNGRHFFSEFLNCEGQTMEGVIGYVSRVQTSQTPRALYRCYNRHVPQHMHSVGRLCPPGTIQENLLGFVR